MHGVSPGLMGGFDGVVGWPIRVRVPWSH